MSILVIVVPATQKSFISLDTSALVNLSLLLPKRKLKKLSGGFFSNGEWAQQ
jgi:hypothetical protein